MSIELYYVHKLLFFNMITYENFLSFSSSQGTKYSIFFIVILRLQIEWTVIFLSPYICKLRQPYQINERNACGTKANSMMLVYSQILNQQV